MALTLSAREWYKRLTLKARKNQTFIHQSVYFRNSETSLFLPSPRLIWGCQNLSFDFPWMNTWIANIQKTEVGEIWLHFSYWTSIAATQWQYASKWGEDQTPDNFYLSFWWHRIFMREKWPKKGIRQTWFFKASVCFFG